MLREILDRIMGRNTSSLVQLDDGVLTPAQKVSAASDLYQLANVLRGFKNDQVVYNNFDPGQYENMVELISDTALKYSENHVLANLNMVERMIEDDNFPKIYGIPEKFRSLIASN